MAELLRKSGEVIRNWQLSKPEAKHHLRGSAVDARANIDLLSLDSETREGGTDRNDKRELYKLGTSYFKYK